MPWTSAWHCSAGRVLRFRLLVAALQVNPGRSGAHRVAALLFKQPSRARGSAPHSRSCFEVCTPVAQ